MNSSPESYYDWLCQVTGFLRRTRSRDDRFVFINAWNEWAEGCHLEPDQEFGYGWLNATKLALQEESTEAGPADSTNEANAVGAPLDLKAFDGSGLKPDGSAYESDVLRETLFPDFKSFGPLNVLFVSHDAHPHGAQKLLLTLTSWLKEKGLVPFGWPRPALRGVPENWSGS